MWPVMHLTLLVFWYMNKCTFSFQQDFVDKAP